MTFQKETMTQAIQSTSAVLIVHATTAYIYTAAKDSARKEVLAMTEYIEKWSIVNRLIDIENEFQQYKPFHGFEHAMYRKICEAEIAIGKTQAADVAPVRHGRWVHHIAGGKQISACWCSVCNVEHETEQNYCPNCGAKMDGGVEAR